MARPGGREPPEFAKVQASATFRGLLGAMRIAALLRPVGIDWFHAPTIGIVRG
jgi:hypothetical protein